MSAALATPPPLLPCEAQEKALQRHIAKIERELIEAAEVFEPHRQQIIGARKLYEEAFAFFAGVTFDCELERAARMLTQRTVAETILQREDEARAEYNETRKRLIVQREHAERELLNFQDILPKLREEQLRARRAEERRQRPQQILIDPLRPDERINVLADGSTVITQTDDRWSASNPV